MSLETPPAISPDKGVLRRLRERRGGPLHIVDPFKIGVEEAVEKARAVEDAGFPVLLVGSTDYVDFAARMPGYVARLREACTLPLILHFPPQPGAGFPLVPNAHAAFMPALLTSTSGYFVWRSLLETLALGRREELPELIPSAALTFGPDRVSWEAMGTLPVERTAEAMRPFSAVIELLGFDLVYLYGRTEEVTPKVCRIVREQIDPQRLVFVGGGVRSRAAVEAYLDAGADYVVFGGALEHPGWRESLAGLASASTVVA